MSIDDINQLDVKSPDWHKDVLDERIKNINNDTAKFLSIKELKNK